MSDIFFWQRWNKIYRYFYIFLLATFALSIIYFLTGWYLGIDAVIDWKTVSQIEPLDSPVDSFIQNLLNYSVEVNTFLVKEQYDASGIQINPVSSYIYFAFVLLAFIYIITLVTYLDIFWFGLGFAGFLFFLATMKTELIKVFGQESKLFLIALIVTYLGISYYFHSFRKETHFWQRFLIFAALTLVAGIVAAAGSRIPYPILFLSNFSVPVPIIITVLFMMTVGFENIYGFLYLSTSGKSTNPKSRILNFLIITALYMLNLILIFLRKMNFIDWDILYISPFIIFLISSIYGIWSYRERNQKSDFVPFAPHGAYLYLAMGTISFATIGLAFITGNDPMTEMFEYAIVFTQLAYGFAFTFYLLINFGDLFPKNVNIYKVAYDWRRMPFLIMQGVSMVILLALFFYSNRFVYYLGSAGYYNLGGDVYTSQRNLLLANEYYKEGFRYAFQNHRSNYSLATLALMEDQKNTATRFLTQAVSRNPSEYAYVLLANLYHDANMYFPAVFTLRDASSKFSESPYINNNLGLLYTKSNSVDSAYYFLNKATENSEDAVPSANMLAFLSTKGLLTDADSIAQAKKFDKDPAFQNNLLIIKTSLNQPYTNPFISDYYKDSVVDGSEFPYLYNFGLKKLRDKDQEIFNLTNALKNNPANASFKDHLSLITGLRKWYTGNKAEALKELDMLKLNENMSAYFNKIIGMLLFKQGAYLNASAYLKEAHKDIDQEAMLYLAVTYLELNLKTDALPLLEKVSTSQFKDLQLIASNLLMITKADISKAANWDNELRYQFFHFRRYDLSMEQKIELAQSFDNQNIKVLAIAELMKEHLDKEETGKAAELYDATGLPETAGSYFAGEYNLQYMRLMEKEGNWQELSKALQELKLNDNAAGLSNYFQARIQETGGKPKEASVSFKKALDANPFTDDVYLNYSRLLIRLNQKDDAYNMLVNGLELLPRSIKLYKEYIKLAYQLNLRNFAQDALEKLSGLISPAEMNAFRYEIKPLTDPQ